MGQVKFKDKVVFEGLIAHIVKNYNWCDSMATYYPYIRVISMLDGQMRGQSINIDGLNDPYDFRFIEVVVDEANKLEYDSFLAREWALSKAEEIHMQDPVKVVKGRKLPVGLEGEIMWIGDTRWGKRVGLRLKDGSVEFTDIRNVKTIEYLRLTGEHRG